MSKSRLQPFKVPPPSIERSPARSISDAQLLALLDQQSLPPPNMDDAKECLLFLEPIKMDPSGLTLDGNHMEMAKAAGAQLWKLPSPVNCDVAFESSGEKMKIAHQCSVNLNIRTVAGPVIVRNVKMLVCSQPMKHLLVGNSLLKELGIDVDLQMSELAGQDFDLSIGMEPSVCSFDRALLQPTDGFGSTPGFPRGRTQPCD